MFEIEISPDLRGEASPVMNLHVTVRVTLHFNETVRSWWGLGVANHILREDPSNMMIIGRFFSWGVVKTLQEPPMPLPQSPTRPAKTLRLPATR